ncbi:MAG: glycosyl transferase [Thermodesulfobacteriota bacterium]|nr:MAG: glycosyl transferase [Thermodesulfobacteriota bacterium]
MDRLGIETELIIPSNRNRTQLFKYYGIDSTFRLTSFPYFENTSLRNIIHGFLASIYIKFFRSKRYDIVVTRNIVFAYFATKFFNIPTVYDAHHPLVKGGGALFNSFKDSEYLIRFSTNSKGLSQIYLNQGLPKDKLVVAHNGVELERFQNIPSKIECRNNLGLPLDKKIVCYAGNIYEGRGVEQLIDVAERLSDIIFLIVGGLDEDVDRYRRIAESKGTQNFELTGFVPHRSVPLYLNASDILVMPYTSKMTIKGGTKAQEFTSPIKLFEYMAAARPIVATSISSVKEVLEDGINAILVEPDSSEALCHGIEKVLREDALAQSIASEAVSNIKKYTWEVRAKKLLGIK